MQADYTREDCWALTRALPDASDVSTTNLNKAFNDVASVRQPKTAELVNAARSAGMSRIVFGGDDDIDGRNKRDEIIKAEWDDVAKLVKMQDELYTGPFEDRGAYQRTLEVMQRT
jgi:hypothetical protein